MAVRKKVARGPQETTTPDKIDPASHLAKVREAIRTLPTDEELMQNEAGTATETSTTPKGPRKVAKKAAKKAPAKKAVKKAASDQISLAEICKGIKGMLPRRARRLLRTADVKSIEVDGARWSWKKGGPAHHKVIELLKAADAE